MIVSQLKKPAKYRQPFLFQQPLGNHGHRRYVIGDFMESLTASVLGCDRHVCSSKAEYCPDMSIRPGDGLLGRIYVECKAVGLTKEAFVYAGRLAKDRIFYNEGNDLFYVIWHHKVKTLNYDTVEDLQSALLQKLQWMAVVPFPYIDELSKKLPEEKINTRYGIKHYKRPYGESSNARIYGSGIRIPLVLIEPFIYLRWKYDGISQTI